MRIKRRSKKAITLHKVPPTEVNTDFFAHCTAQVYNEEEATTVRYQKLEEIKLGKEGKKIHWLNVYGLRYAQATKYIVQANQLDEFLLNLLQEPNHRSKAIALDNCFFLTLRSPYTSPEGEQRFEQLAFVVGPSYVWTIQEMEGDHFDYIRERISTGTGMVRRKGVDYLLYLLLEAIVDNYYQYFEKIAEVELNTDNLQQVKPNPDFALQIEQSKKLLYTTKRNAMNLKEALLQLENVELEAFDPKYYSEIRAQISLLNDEIDFQLQQLESFLNLLFSMQSHRLNEVMKTLTIFSVIFIPLTFMAGIYGMNFEYIPELKARNGYFILLGVMALTTLLALWYIRRKKWFD